MNKNSIVIILLIAITTIGLQSLLFSKDPGFIIITSLYNEQNPARIEEYKICMDKNIADPRIKHIHVLYDTIKDIDTPLTLFSYLEQFSKITITKIQGRPTYGYCFDLANKLYPNSAIILCNADIYFNETLSLIDTAKLDNKFLALTRWNVEEDGSLRFYKSPFSQDTWIFTTPIRPFFDANIQIGTVHCDGRISFEAHRAGLMVQNPSLTIQTCHVHLSNVRNYERRNDLPRNIRPLKPHPLQN